MRLRSALASVALAALAAACAGGASKPGADAVAASDAEFRALYKELVEVNTTASVGSCTKASEAMKARLVAAGFPESDLHIIIPEDQNDGNLVAVLPGSDPAKGAMMLLAHIDVVEAKREDWVRDPFTLIEEDGYLYARGTVDDKAMAAIFADSMVRWKKSGYKPARTIKMALTCGEEGGSTNGVRYMLTNHRELIDAEFALNEGGGGRMDEKTGKYLFNGVQAGEKRAMNYKLEVTNPGGHSSRPVPENAIYRMSEALEKISTLDFPVEFNEATRGYFEKMADIIGGSEGADMKAALEEGGAAAIERLKKNPTYNSFLHTTCVTTQLTAGHAPNALPQNATATVNCRIFPGRTVQETGDQIEAQIGDPQVKLIYNRDMVDTPAPPPALTPEILGPIMKLTEEMWPGVPVIPAMAAGATDGRAMIQAGIPTYGVSGIFTDPATTGTHGLNERIRIKSLMEGRAFLHTLSMVYAGGE